MDAFTVWTRVGYNGQEIYAFDLTCEQEPKADEISLANPFTDSSIECFLRMKTRQLSGGIQSTSFDGQYLHIDVHPFSFKAPYLLNVGTKVYTAADVQTVHTQTADDFTAEQDGALLYRLYRPAVKGPRPLILFLHGGGESGRDNWRQLVSCYGPTRLAERYPDCYIMAPQAMGREPTQEEIESFKRLTFATSDQPTDIGWNRPYLGLICNKIRAMITEGLVQEQRVYVTGLSMGGAGTLRALSVGSDLFAAALPVCPSMTPETYAILRGLTQAKLWIMAAYIDHTLYRHKYLVDGILHLRDEGNRNAKLSLFSPEELAEYGIGTIDDMPLEARFGWNHACWVLAYENVHGALGWMVEQCRSPAR